MNLNPVRSNASKSEELETLKKAAKLFEPGTYLHDLFTERFFDWIESSMKNDFPPDIYEVIETLQKDSARETSARIQAENNAAQTEKGLRRAIADIESQVKRSDEESERQCNRLIQTEKDLTEERVTHQATRGQLAAAQRVIECREDEILRLKAKLYDTQNRLNNTPEE